MMARSTRQPEDRRGERGMTLIEVVVAALVLTMAAMASFALLASATKNAQRARSTQVALDLAQEEIERLRSIPYEDLALSSYPQPSPSKLNPGFRVQGTQFALKRSPLGEYAPLVKAIGTGFSPESSFSSGNPSSGGITGTIYRYVVWRNDPSCPDAQCPGPEDYKQVVVAVQPKAAVGEGQRGYVEVQAKRVDPEVLNEPPPPAEEGEEGEKGNGLTAQQFYLSDTPCSPTGTTTRQAIASDHLLHNTLGTCASGLRTGGTLGAPDALLLSGPPDPDPENQLVPAFYDYSDDLYLEPTPDTDKGLQIRHDDSEGCNYDPTGTSTPESQVHRWVSDPMPKAFVISGGVTLEFYTRTLNDAIYTGRLCVYLFERSKGVEGKENDEFFADTNETPYWVYEPGDGVGFWPRNMWTKIRRKMQIDDAPEVIDPGNRLGVALSVDVSNTTGDALAVMYDHPNYPTRLEVETTAASLGG
jgi:hypothetical protein